MNILQILPELNIGGVERGTVDLARELLRRGHQALVISNGGVLVEELESTGARHIRLSVHRKSLFSIIINIAKLSRILQQEKVDIVHARSRIPALIAFFACRNTGTNFVTTCHGYYSQNFFSRVMGWGKRVIVSSSAISRHMIEDFSVPPERISFIARGVDLNKFKFLQRTENREHRTDAFVIGVIGRLTPIKGHKYFLQALAKVIRSVPNVKALIVGDISPGKEKYKDELLILTRRLSLDRYVEFTGRQNNIPQVLARLNALVLPTITQEAFGRVLIEAAACGVPVIATRVGGVTDIITDGENGVLVEPKDPQALAQAIIKLFKQPNLAQQLVAAGRKNVEEKFSLEQMAVHTIKVYEQVQKSLKILVIKLSALGDLILAVPTLRALREKFPQSKITVLVGRPYRAILENCPYINQIFELDSTKRTYQPIWAISALLRPEVFDFAVDLQNNRRSHLLSYLSGISKRYGYANGKFSFLLNKKIKDSGEALSPIRHQGRTLKLLGIESVKEELELWPQEKDESWAQDFLQKHRRQKTAPLVGINLEASFTWPTKRWPMENLAEFLDQLQESGIEAVITGKKESSEQADRLGQLTRYSFINALGQTQVMQLACLIKRCNVYITSDSAPLHIAYAMRTPVVALFGPTDPKRHALDSARQVIIQKQLPCVPCYKRHCREHSCMKQISAAEVFAAVKRLL
ncbi:MAG: lipopolysaccharide heptosyltransferase II [Candidatus Omnitrophica bacterium]|nr:lipopolysaccharide heptosyltransferase II [Candidatus Omnitrophota bacterium]